MGQRCGARTCGDDGRGGACRRRLAVHRLPGRERQPAGGCRRPAQGRAGDPPAGLCAQHGGADARHPPIGLGRRGHPGARIAHLRRPVLRPGPAGHQRRAQRTPAAPRAAHRRGPGAGALAGALSHGGPRGRHHHVLAPRRRPAARTSSDDGASRSSWVACRPAAPASATWTPTTSVARWRRRPTSCGWAGRRGDARRTA